MSNFWETLEKPIMCLAPMADVTDPPFRRIIAKYGKPDILWTEFVSVDGLCSEGRDRILKDIEYIEEERPIILQIFGSKPENFKKVAELAQELKFDGVDINMGCPDRSVEKQGGGSALIKEKELAQDIIRATMEGAGPLPVSVKTRIGYSENEISTWIPKLLETDITALTIHARTRQQMSKVPADWSTVKDAAEIRNRMNSRALILGNGDVLTPADGHKKVEETGCDGVMIGRGIFGNPWLFNKKVRKEDLPLAEVLSVLVEHTKLYDELMGGLKSFAVMKKHFKAYVQGFDGAKDLRIKLMETNSSDEVAHVVAEHLEQNKEGVVV